MHILCDSAAPTGMCDFGCRGRVVENSHFGLENSAWGLVHISKLLGNIALQKFLC